MSNICKAVPFPEPQNGNAKEHLRSEKHIDWIRYSTAPNAQRCRDFLNYNFLKVPDSYRQQFVDSMLVRYDGAFFEFIIFRLLQELGAVVEIEKETPEGKKPDFWASFADGPVIVEATVHDQVKSLTEERKRRAPLLDIIASKAPYGWFVIIELLPEIGLNDSKKEFKANVAEMFANINAPAEPNENIRIISRDGTIRFRLIPNIGNRGMIGIEPAYAVWGTAVESIQRSIKTKRKQVRGTKHLVLLAICSTKANSEMQDFDTALYYGYSINQAEKRDRGILIAGEGEPTIAGVLAFTRVGCTCCSNPVLYRHPRFKRTLPAALLQLKQRKYSPDTGQIERIPAQRSDLIDALRLAKFD